MKFPGFVGPTYDSQSPDADAERCINWYVEAIESGNGKSRAALYPTPGSHVFAIPTAAQQVAISGVEVTRKGATSGAISTVEVISYDSLQNAPTVGATGTGGTGSVDYYASPADVTANATSHSGTVVVSQQTPAFAFPSASVGTSPVTLSFVVNVSVFPDSPNGGSVEVDYSIDNGSSWIEIATYGAEGVHNVSYLVAGLTNINTLGLRVRSTATWNSGLSAIVDATASSIHATISGGGTWAITSAGGFVTNATITEGTNVLSNSLLLNTFGFTGPTGRTFLGAKVDCNFTATVTTPSANTWKVIVSLVYQGSAIGTPKTFTQAANDSATPLTFGSSSDLWGATLTDAIVADPTFGIMVQVQATSSSAVSFGVAVPKLTIYSSGHYYPKYQLPGGTVGFSVGQSVIPYTLTQGTFLNGQAMTITAIAGNFITCQYDGHTSAYPQANCTGTLYNAVPTYAILTTVGTDPFSSGAVITFSGFALATWLNGYSATIASTPTANTFTVPITQADLAATADTGIAFVGAITTTPAARAVFSVNGTRFFAVVQANVFEVFSDGTFTNRGNVVDDGNPADITANVNQLLIASGGGLYVLNLVTNVLTNVPTYIDSSPIEPISLVDYCDGYFIAVLANSQKFIVSAILDGTQWDAAMVAVVSVFPDNIKSMKVDHREVWIQGARHSVVYGDSGNADFPFDVIPGSYIDQGSAGIRGTVRIDNSILWIGEDDRGGRMAWRANGYVPQRISNHAIEYQWSTYSTVADVVSYGYQDQGHAFWVILFPTAGKTWVYDAATGAWHERAFWNGASYTAHRSQNHAYCFGRHLVGDWSTGTIYDMNIGYFDDFGNPILRTRRCPILADEDKWYYFPYLQIDLEVGLGLSSGQGSDPQVMLRYSDDGAKTWSTIQTASAGKQGEYRTRVMFRRLGRSRSRVFEVSVSDPIPWRVIDCYMGAQDGTA